MTETLEMTNERRARTGPAKFTLTISRLMLHEALRKLMAAVPTKLSIPVLGCVLIDVRESVESLIEGDAPRAQKITMTATNLDSTVTLDVGASVVGSGVAALPAKRLSDIVANLPAGATITIAVDGTMAKLRAGRTAYEIVGMPVDEFPQHTQRALNAEAITFVAAPFVDALTRAAKFTPDEAHASPQCLTAVCVQVEDGKVLCVATTRHILVRLIGGEAAGARNSREYLIDRDTISGIVRLFGALPDGAQLHLVADENRASFQSGDDRLEIRLLDGPYVSYRPILGLSPTRSVTFDREQLAATLRRIALITEGDKRRAEATFSADADEMVVRATTADKGNAEDVVAIASRDNHGDSQRPAFRFAFNAMKFLVAVETHTAAQVTLSFDTADRGFHVRPVGDPTDLLTLSLVMPLRIND